MMKSLLSPSVLVVLLLVALATSLAGNYFLFNKAIQFYQRESETRLTPVSHRYARDNAAIAASEKTKPRIIIFGESRCSMWLPHHPDNWGDVEIINRGIGGETTAQIRARLESDVIALDPDLVILQMGDNDLKTIAVLEDRKEQIIENTEGNIVHIAETLADQGIDVIITTIFPTGPIGLLRRPIWSDEVNESIDYVNRRLLAFQAPRVTVADCDAFLREGEYIKPEYALDTLHLTPAGYQVLNEKLEPVVRTALAD